MDKNSLHFRGTYRNLYEVNRAYPNGGVDGDYVDINGWQHWWNPDRGTWCVNENRDSYWDEVLSTVQNLLFSKACVSESDFPLNPTDEEKRFGYFYNGELYLWTGTNGTVRNGQYRSFGVVQGERGVGVSSIAQTSTSNVDGGKNEITVTLTNGDSYKFFTYNGTGRNKGYYYRTLDELKQAVPSPTVTDWAIVDGSVYVCDEAGVWKDTTYSWKPIKLNPFVTELNKMDMPTSTGYLYWNGQSFGWKTPVVNNGGGNTGGGTSIDLSEYSWWGRKFDPASKMITGEMSAVTSIEFQSTKGETTIRKKLYLDENGDLCFNGNFYATGGITALGSGGGTSGGGSASLGTLLTKLNSDNPFPTNNGQVLTYDGSNFIWKTSTGSGVALSPVMSAMNDQLGKTSYGTPQFLYWTGSKYTWKNESEISGSGGAGSIQVAELPEYSGGSENWINATKLRFINISDSTKPTVRSNSAKDCIDIGIPVGSGSGSSSRIKKIKLFNSHSDYSFETIDLGTADTIGFMAGNNVTLEAVVKEYVNVIKISATGGSSTGGGSVDLSSYLTKTEASTTYAAKSHTHSAASIIGFEDAVKLVKVNNATNADKATQLANPRLIWGQSFNGTGNINGHLYMGTAGGDSIQLYMNNGNMLDRTNNTLHIGYGLKESSDGEISLDAYITRIYTDNMTRHYDFKSNVFDVNTNAIHFGSGASGGKISWDRANNAFKIEGNVYATGGITALGVSNNATTSNNLDFTFKSVSINGTKQDKVQLTDRGLTFYSHPNILGAYYKKNAIGLYDSNNDTCCAIFSFTDSTLNFDPQGYSFDIYFNQAIGCTTDENTLQVGNNSHIGYIVFSAGSTMTFNHNDKNYNFNVAKAIEQGILTI